MPYGHVRRRVIPAAGPSSRRYTARMPLKRYPRRGCEASSSTVTSTTEQHVTPPSAFASSPAGTERVTKPCASRRRRVRGCSSAQITTSPTRSTLAAAGSDGSTSMSSKPSKIDASTQAGFDHEVAPGFRPGDPPQARRRDRRLSSAGSQSTGTGMTSKPSGAMWLRPAAGRPRRWSARRCRRTPGRASPARRRRRACPGGSMKARRRCGRSAADHRVDLRPPRFRARPRDHRDVVEHDRRVLDEHRVGQVRRVGSRCTRASQREPAPPHTPRAAPPRARNRSAPRQVRQLAAIDAERNGAGKSNRRCRFFTGDQEIRRNLLQ